jgi:hypothetical protein
MSELVVEGGLGRGVEAIDFRDLAVEEVWRQLILEICAAVARAGCSGWAGGLTGGMSTMLVS